MKRYKRWIAKKSIRKAIDGAQGYHLRYHDSSSDSLTFEGCAKWPCYINRDFIIGARVMLK